MSGFYFRFPASKAVVLVAVCGLGLLLLHAGLDELHHFGDLPAEFLLAFFDFKLTFLECIHITPDYLEQLEGLLLGQ